ncbi:Uncharacterised protein [marine metagenome]
MPIIPYIKLFDAAMFASGWKRLRAAVEPRRTKSLAPVLNLTVVLSLGSQVAERRQICSSVLGNVGWNPFCEVAKPLVIKPSSLRSRYASLIARLSVTGAFSVTSAVSPWLLSRLTLTLPDISSPTVAEAEVTLIAPASVFLPKRIP